jgi:PrtD family type I secretion system ABC transporter
MSSHRLPSPSAELREGLARCRMALVGVALISAVINTLFLSGPLFMLEVYDRVLPSHSLPTLVVLICIVAVLYLFQGLLDVVRSRILARAGAVVSTCAAADTFHLAMSGALHRPAGEVAGQPFADLDQIRSFLSGPCLGALFDLPWIPLYLVVCFAFHPWIGVAGLAGAVFLLLLTIATDVLSRNRLAGAGRHAGSRNAICEEGMRHAEVVHAMGLEKRLCSLWGERNQALVAEQVGLSDVGSAFGAISKSFRMFLQSGVLALGAYLVIEGEVTAGVIVASGILVSRALAPVELSIANWRNFIAARQSWKRLSTALKSGRGSELMALPAPEKLLGVEDLVLLTPDGERTVISQASFSLKAGEAMAIIGPSAAGKSSLARALVGLWTPARGSVRLDNAPLEYWNRDDLGRHVGYLPQDVELFSGTIAENISRFEPGAASDDIITAARAADVHEMILRLPAGYNTDIGQSGRLLSMGQRQRIGLARALYGKPFLVVLDEPNSNLDSDGEAALTRAINGIRERNGIAVVIAHRASALAACDLIMMVSNGTAQLLGRSEDVMHKVRPVSSSQSMPQPASAIELRNAVPRVEAAQ